MWWSPRLLTLSVAMLFVLVSSVPALAEEDATKVLSTLPLGPDTETFHVSLTNTKDGEYCRQAVRDAFGFNNKSTAEHLYATNDPDDPCRSATPPTLSPHQQSVTSNTDLEHTFNIHLMPVVDEIVFREGENIVGTLHLFTERVGTIEPTVSLHDREGQVGVDWSSDGPDPKADGAKDPTDGLQYHTFAFDLGPAPKGAKGALMLNISVYIEASADGQHVGYASATKYGVGFTGDDAGTITLPVKEAVVPTPETDAPPVDNVTCPDGSEVENIACPDDETDEEPASDDAPGDFTQTIDPTTDGRNATEPSDDKGLPGFGLATGIAAFGAVAVGLRRRRS